MNNLLQTYFITKGEHGIVHLLINLLDKQTCIQKQGDEEFWLWSDEDSVMEQREFIRGLPTSTTHSCFNRRNKDQVEYIFVPTHLYLEEGKLKDKFRERYENNL